MNKRQLAADRTGFYTGIVTALAVVELHNADTIYDEIVALCDIRELMAHAKANDELQWSGLVRWIERSSKEAE